MSKYLNKIAQGFIHGSGFSMRARAQEMHRGPRSRNR